MTRFLLYWLSLVLGIGMTILLTLPMAWAAGQIADRMNVWVGRHRHADAGLWFCRRVDVARLSTRLGDRMGDALYCLDPFGFRREREPR